ncbi:SNF2-related:helicase (plasmid) [Deinococcus metallilatus]|uniref:SNF2-related:helicase n=1 Tax=Deinococcus metallilatus TaxID=1211322 RepID=A0AAJ5F4W0_9DEIO|nr:helicase-related protein [Deinococcus metallilatus]QBY07204.1 SNF2-related:helicase [Deinococcus metallilatus]RXJ14676.1 SNF2-related:helicase [Deinococcus metallilatus]TLK30796.1 SNF2-related:helicase [Deinococcus metallilatus]
MIKGFALSAVTGFLALFGLNCEVPYTRMGCPKFSPADKSALALNGTLLTREGYDVVSAPQPALTPGGELYGVEVTGGAQQARLNANEAARHEILAPHPDLAVLRAYGGGGGLGESVDQFYTPSAVAALLWNLVTPFLKLGDEKRPVRALEPSCGNGAVLAHAPEGVLLTGVELDPVAGRAAAHLHPHASIHVMPLEQYTTRSSDPLFDLVVANPPYGPRGETRSLHEPDEVRSERYFMRQILRRVQFQTGLVSVLLPLSLLHGHRHRDWREELLTSALPLHAVLVPTGAFKAAGAGVTTVLLVLRRHDHGVREALSTLGGAQVTDTLLEFVADPVHRELVERFVDGSSLIITEGEEGAWTHRLRQLSGSFRLSQESTLRCGRFGNPLLEGEVDTRQVERVHDQMQAAMNSAPVLFRTLIETVRERLGEDAARNAEAASHVADLHAIPEGTLSTDRRHAFRLGQWVVTDDFAAPVVAQAVQVAQALQAYLEARELGRPETPQRRRTALALDVQYRATHGAYDRQRFTRLISRYSLFAVLLAHLSALGELNLPDDGTYALPITASGMEGIAQQLADLMALTEQTLMEYAGVSEPEAVTHLTGHYAFNGEIWVEPGLYYSGHAFLRAEQARAQAEHFGGHRRAALTRQADLFISRVRRANLSELALSPRDAVIPVAVLEEWVNAYLGSAADQKPLISVRRENGAVRFRLKGGAGQAGVRARSAFDQEKARALENYLNHKTEVEAVRGAGEMSREQYQAERATAIDAAQAYEDQTQAHFGNWLMQSPHVGVVEEAYTYARGAILRPEGTARPLHLPDWRGPEHHPYQVMDIRAMAATTGMVNNYDVGLGKTFAMLGLIAYLKTCGRASRPIVVVPAGLVSNWATNAALALPDWNIVTVGMSVRRDRQGNKVYKTKRDGTPMLDQGGKRIEAWKEDSPAVKREKIASLSAGQVDLVIMSRESFTGIGMLRETRQRLILEDPQYQRNLETADSYEGTPKRGKHQELVRKLGVFGAMLARTKIAQEGELSFELLGCDFTGHDEAHCFPAGTLVDGKYIEAYRAGERVRAFNHVTGRIESARVLNLQVRRPHDLLRLTLEDGRQIITTGNHPFFTPAGYLDARQLTPGETLYVDKQCNAPLRSVPDADLALQGAAHPSEAWAAGLLRESVHPTASAPDEAETASPQDSAALRGMRRPVHPEQRAVLEAAHRKGDAVLLQQVLPHEAHGQNQPEIQGQCAGRQPCPDRRAQGADGGDAQEGRPAGSGGPDARNDEGAGSQAPDPRRQWTGSDGAASSPLGGTVATDGRGMDSGAPDQDGPEAAGLPTGLQGGFGASHPAPCRRVRRAVTQVAFPAGSGPKEGGDTVLTRLASLEILEPGDHGEYGGLCPGGLVYNIEVEGHHNYFAEGILVHNCNKNLFAPPTTFGETPRFLGGGGESQRALDALHKGRFVRERGGSTFAFTASWIKNSPLEVYSMLSMVTDALPGYGLPTGEALMEQYLRIEPDIVTGMDGRVEVKPCVKGFRRLRELKGIISGHVITRSYGDPLVVTRDGQPLKVPSAVAEEVMIDMSEEQAVLYRSLRERARTADARAKGPNHPFAILWEMRKLTVDPALLGVGGRNPRFEKITELALENRASGGKGIVFLSIGEKEGSFARLKALLVEAGYPEHEIAIVSSDTHKSSVARQDLEDDYNFGDLSLILGTDVLGQGFNLQHGTTLIVNADIPWNYEEIRQRVGRGARQGNTAERVRNVYLLMRGSFDAITYTIMSGKKSWLSQLWLDVDELENTAAGFNGEEMALLLSDDPEQTRREIREKKKTLEELTGRAALRRNLEVLARVLSVQGRVQTVRERAHARKNGWTANDHALLTQAREASGRVRRELDLLGEFSFARLLNYVGELHWIGVLPVHVGLTFVHEGGRVEVTQVSAGAVTAVRETGESTVLNFRQVTGGAGYEASTHSGHYRESLSLGARPTISLPKNAAVHALDARRVNPVPRNPEGVISVSVRGDEVMLHASPDKYALRSLLITGHVVMHYAVRTEGEHLTVTQVAVLSGDPRVVEGTGKQLVSERFRERLLAIVATALGADPIRDRAHAA